MATLVAVIGGIAWLRYLCIILLDVNGHTTIFSIYGLQLTVLNFQDDGFVLIIRNGYLTCIKVSLYYLVSTFCSYCTFIALTCRT